MTVEEFLNGGEDIHDVQAKVMEWVATDDLCQMVNKRKIEDEEKKLALEVDLLNAIVRALQNKNTDYGKRMRGVALGLFTIMSLSCSVFNCSFRMAIWVMTF